MLYDVISRNAAQIFDRDDVCVAERLWFLGGVMRLLSVKYPHSEVYPDFSGCEGELKAYIGRTFTSLSRVYHAYCINKDVSAADRSQLCSEMFEYYFPLKYINVPKRMVLTESECIQFLRRSVSSDQTLKEFFAVCFYFYPGLDVGRADT